MIKIIIADDHAILVEGLLEILAKNSNYHIVGTASNGLEVLKLLARKKADLIIMDINMPKMDGLETTHEVTKKYADTKVLVMSMYNNREYIKSAIKSGASGYILKNTSPKELDLAINSINEGGSYFSQEVSMMMASSMRKDQVFSDEDVKLSPHETELLKLLSEGLTSDEISVVMKTSPHTIRSYRRNLLHKFQVKNVTQLMVVAMKGGYVD